MKFSSKVQKCQLSPVRQFNPCAAEAEAKGRTIYHLNIGQPDIKTPDAFFEAVRNFKKPVLEYAPTPGLPEYLDAVRGYYAKIGIKLDRSDILVTSGAGGHQNVAPVQLDADLCVIAADGIQIFRQARRGSIFQHRLLEVPNRFKERVRCFDVRLADIQMINGTALGLCLRRAGIELAHRGQLAFLNLTGKFHGNTPPSK